MCRSTTPESYTYNVNDALPFARQRMLVALHCPRAHADAVFVYARPRPMMELANAPSIKILFNPLARR